MEIELFNNEELDFEDIYDYDFSYNQIYINTFEEYIEKLLEPFLDKSRNIFYRGERINSLSRPLIPSIYRKKENFLYDDIDEIMVDRNAIYNFYKNKGVLVKAFNSCFGHADENNIYDLCAFSQHYLGISPLIDFSKSLYVSCSFALKGLHKHENDAVLYVLEINNPNYYTTDIEIAEKWFDEYKVKVSNKTLREKDNDEDKFLPKGKIIDIATNDFMKYQKGCFLLLTDYHMRNNLYLTKRLRQNLKIKKYILNKDICPKIVEYIEKKAPWYNYDCLMNIPQGLNKAMKYYEDM